jgi:hypothetical protein
MAASSISAVALLSFDVSCRILFSSAIANGERFVFAADFLPIAFRPGGVNPQGGIALNVSVVNKFA